jgi:hypothetical protein
MNDVNVLNLDLVVGAVVSTLVKSHQLHTLKIRASYACYSPREYVYIFNMSSQLFSDLFSFSTKENIERNEVFSMNKYLSCVSISKKWPLTQIWELTPMISAALETENSQRLAPDKSKTLTEK